MIQALNIINKAHQYYKANGLSALMKKIYKSVRIEDVNKYIQKADVIGFYSFVTNQPCGKKIVSGDVVNKTINWFIPPFGFGSGGHLNIFRFVYALEKEGYECNIIIVGEPIPISSNNAKKQIKDWFYDIKANVYIGIENAPPTNITVATSWQTAYYVRSFQSTIHKCYFVQDYEPMFYSSGSEYYLAKNTYSFGFVGITAGGWLKNKLTNEHNMTCYDYSFSYDKDLYSVKQRREKEIKRLFFYARPPTTRRGFELGLLAINSFVSKHKEIKVIFAGWDISNYKIDFEHLNCGTLNISELSDLYNQCDAALVLSFSNVSLLPLELMACGVPVICNKAPFTEWLLDDNCCFQVEPTIESIENALIEVFYDTDKYNHIRNNAIDRAKSTSWDTEVLKVRQVFEQLSEGQTTNE